MILPFGKGRGPVNGSLCSHQACVSQNSRELFGPKKLPVKPPKTISGVPQSPRTFRARGKSRHFPQKIFGCLRAPEKNFFRVKILSKKMATAVGALLLPNREKRNYDTRTVLDGIRRNEVVERYRLSPKRIMWLINKLESELRPNTNRNFPLSAETQVSEFLFIYLLVIITCEKAVSQW